MQVEQSEQDKVEATQQQQEVLLLAFTCFKDLLANAEEASKEDEASHGEIMNGTTDGSAGKSTKSRQEFQWERQSKALSTPLHAKCTALQYGSALLHDGEWSASN